MSSLPEVESEADRRFQKRFWLFQRFAWAGMVLVLVAALAGLTGKGGPLSRTTVSDAQASVTYPRVARWESADDIQIELSPAISGRAEIDIGDEFARIFQVEDIHPQPSRSFATGTGQRLVFDLGEPAGPRTITLHVRPLHPSVSAAPSVRINGGEALVMSPVVLP